MARRKKSDEETVSLFPFLSILACVIGALTLIISSLSLSQVNEGRQDKDIARAEDYVALEKSLLAKKKTLELKRTQSKAENDRLQRFRELEAESKKLDREIKTLEQSRDKRLELTARSTAQQVELEKLIAAKNEIKKQVAQSMQQLAVLKKKAGSEGEPNPEASPNEDEEDEVVEEEEDEADEEGEEGEENQEE